MRRYDTAGIRQEHPAFAVPAPYRRCGDRTTIDQHMIGDFETLSRTCCDGLDQRREPAGAKPSPQISAPPSFCERGCHGWAQKHQIADRDRTLKLFDTPKSERLAWGQVQPVAADEPGRRQCGHSDGRARQKQKKAPRPHCFSTGVWRWVRR